MQLHKRLNIERVRLVLDWYERGLISQGEALQQLGLKRRQFFTLLKRFRSGQLRTVQPTRRNSHRKIPSVVERCIRTELEKEKQLIRDGSMPVSGYNYAAVRDAVVTGTGLLVSTDTVRRRAKAWGYCLVKPASKARAHTRVVLTTATGLLLQHDASHHRWAPLAEQKWCLITTIDDYSRMLLCAEFFEKETAWSHIQALEAVVSTYGVGSNYYTDNHSIFRFVDRLQTYWREARVNTGDVKTQWQRAVKACGMGNIYALSPEAKGKVERPYRWLQDRVVRSCAKAGVTTMKQGQQILQQEVDRYNTKQVHSTTGEIPLLRFQRAEREGNTVFRPLQLPEPYTSTKDIFCLQIERKVNGYGSVVWNKGFLKLPKQIPEGATVTLHVIPDGSHPEIRVWYKTTLVTSLLFRPHSSIRPEDKTSK